MSSSFNNSQTFPCSDADDASAEVGNPGFLVRRIIQSNSGSFNAFGSNGQPLKERGVVQIENKLWTRYKEQAEAALQNCNYAQAEAMWLKALGEAKNFERQDGRLIYSLERLSELYCRLKRFEQAEMFCCRALIAINATYGTSHVRAANCMNNLTGIYYNLNRMTDAEPLCRQVIEIFELTYGPDHVDVGMAANNLGMVYHALSQYEKAKAMYERAWRIRRRALGEEHPSVKSLKHNFQNLLCAMESSSGLHLIDRQV